MINEAFSETYFGFVTWYLFLKRLILPLIVTSLSKGKIFGSEGLAINITTYVDNFETEFLPIKNNFIASHIMPKFNEKSNKTLIKHPIQILLKSYSNTITSTLGVDPAASR